MTREEFQFKKEALEQRTLRWLIAAGVVVILIIAGAVSITSYAQSVCVTQTTKANLKNNVPSGLATTQAGCACGDFHACSALESISKIYKK